MARKRGGPGGRSPESIRAAFVQAIVAELNEHGAAGLNRDRDAALVRVIARTGLTRDE